MKTVLLAYEREQDLATLTTLLESRGLETVHAPGAGDELHRGAQPDGLRVPPHHPGFALGHPRTGRLAGDGGVPAQGKIHHVSAGQHVPVIDQHAHAGHAAPEVVELLPGALPSAHEEPVGAQHPRLGARCGERGELADRPGFEPLVQAYQTLRM